MDTGTAVTRILHQASSFFCWRWQGKLIRKSHDSVGPQMGKVLEKNSQTSGLEGARRGASACHSCVCTWLGPGMAVRESCKDCCQHRLLPGGAPDLHSPWAMESARSTRRHTGIPNFFQCKRSHRKCLGKLCRQEKRERSTRRSKNFRSMIWGQAC